MSKPSLEQIKENIAFARKQAGVTQGEMAKTLNISQPAYSYYESGDKPIPIDKISKIAEILSIPLNRLLGDIAIDQSQKDPLSAISHNLERIANTLDKILATLDTNI